jgi:hypothetical protein
MVNYEEAIRKPFTDLKKFVIGVVLSIIPIVNFTIVKGFAIESSGLGKTRPSAKMPEWKNWTELFVKGLVATVIQIIYFLPAIAVFVITLAGMLTTLMAAGITPEMLMTGDLSMQMMSKWNLIWSMMVGAVWAVPALLVAVILALLAIYTLPIAILNYVAKKKFGAAFALGSVAKKAFTADYFVAWLITAVIVLVIRAILLLIPFIGSIIATFITAVMAYSIFGQVYKRV